MSKNLDQVKRPYRYVLVDGSNVAKWSYHVPQRLTSADGHDTTMLYGVLRLVVTLQRAYPRAKIIFGWEGEHYSVRKQKAQTYKSSRSSKTGEYLEALLEVKDVLPLAGVYQCFQPGLEADDIIGYFATQKKGRKLIVSRDRDMWQHAGPNVDFDLRGNFRTSKVFGLQTAESLSEHLGFPAQNIIMHKILKGDKSDEIKGILRFPNKLAEHLCRSCNTLTDLKRSVQYEDWPSPAFEKWRSVLKQNWETLEENDYLMRFHPEWVDMKQVVKVYPVDDPQLFLNVLMQRSMASLVVDFKLAKLTDRKSKKNKHV